MASEAIRVEGLKDVLRSIGQIDKTLQKSLRGRLKKIGDDVAAEARQSMPVITGRAQSSVKSGFSGGIAYVQAGKKTVPYAAWLDFGGVLKPTGKRRNTITRRRIKKGRYIYPAIERNRSNIQRQAMEAFDATKRELGLD